MKNLTDEIKLTIELMQGDIDDGAHGELQSHLYSLLEMKRELLGERLCHMLTKHDLLRGDWWCADTSESARQAFAARGFNVADQWTLVHLVGCRLTGKESVTRFNCMSQTKGLREITLIDGEFYYCKPQDTGDA